MFIMSFCSAAPITVGRLPCRSSPVFVRFAAEAPDEAYLVPSDRPFLFVAALLRSCFRGPKGLASLSSRSRSPSGTPIPRRARNWIR